MALYFIRHGESEANAKNIVSPIDTQLTQHGVEQSKIIGQRLKNKRIHFILCSPLIRARQTVEIIARELKIPNDRIIIIDELQERHLGKLVDKPRTKPFEFYYKNDSSYTMEPRQVLINRMNKAWIKIKNIASNTSTNILIVGHCVSGYYLSEVIKGHLRFEDFDEVQHLVNAGVKELIINTKK